MVWIISVIFFWTQSTALCYSLDLRLFPALSTQRIHEMEEMGLRFAKQTHYQRLLFPHLCRDMPPPQHSDQARHLEPGSKLTEHRTLDG